MLSPSAGALESLQSLDASSELSCLEKIAKGWPDSSGNQPLFPDNHLLNMSSRIRGGGNCLRSFTQVHVIARYVVPTELHVLVGVVCRGGGEGSGKKLVNINMSER